MSNGRFRLPFACLVAILVAVPVRAMPILSTEFPLNDGGLFLAMTEGLIVNGWLTPTTVAWNGQAVPYAYPPFGFYLAGGIQQLTGLDGLSILRLVPFVFTAAVPALVCLIGARLTGSAVGGGAAGLMYALAPAAFTWPLNGGGITRAPGLAFALLAIWLLIGLLERPTRWQAIALGAASGLTVLTHPGATVFLALSGVLLVGRAVIRHTLPTTTLVSHLAIAAATAVALSLFWVVPVVVRIGVSSLTEVSSNGPHPLDVIAHLVAARATEAPTIDPLAAIVLAFAVLETIRGRLLLPIWWVSSSFISLQYGIVPASLLIGTLAAEAWGLTRQSAPGQRVPGSIGLTLVALALTVEGWFGLTAQQDPESHLHALSPERREAMDWVGANLDQDASVAVLTGDSWSMDADSEWFYQLTGRSSAATVQGSEWMGAGAYREAQVRYQTLQRCAEANADCTAEWLSIWPADYVYVPKGQLDGPSSPADCCPVARQSLVSDARFEVVYDGPGATIFAAP